MGGRMTVLLGGRDAAMGRLDQRFFRLLFGVASIAAVVLLIVALLD